jgi:hypothetical protein
LIILIILGEAYRLWTSMIKNLHNIILKAS